MFPGACYQRSLTLASGIGLMLVLAPCALAAPRNESGLSAAQVAALAKRIPPRPQHALTGSEFVAYIRKMDARQREQAILDQILAGNLPGFLRSLVAVRLAYQSPGGRSSAATVFVMPEYLAVGSDKDFLRIPMNLHTALAVAGQLGFVLPTRKIVDAIYTESSYHFTPEPMQAGPQMRSTEYYQLHNAMIERQSRARNIPLGALVSGDKKDVVLSSRLAHNPGQIAIYGWHRGAGAPIQPLSTVHGANYADYSHGIRLVSETAVVDGQPKSIYEILRDPALAKLLSDEGPIPNPWSLFAFNSGR